MARLSFTFEHELTQKEALRRIKTLLKEVKKEHAGLVSDLEESWEGDTGSFSFIAMGYPIKGTLDVDAPAISLDAEVPLAVRMFKGKIEKILREQADALLA